MHSVQPESVNKSAQVLSLVVDLGTLIVEGRTRQRNAKGGFLEGPHCASIGFPTSSNHICEINNEQCAWIQRLRLQIALLWKNFGSFCIEVSIPPDCLLCGDNSHTMSSSDHIIEQWFISADSKRKESDFVMTNIHFFQAIRSQLHFSQLSAWWNKSGGKSPTRVSRRVANILAVNNSFSQNSNIHTFPLLNVGSSQLIKVTVFSTHRSDQPPVVRCVMHHKLSDVQLQGNVVDDRMKTTCDKAGKHHCDCEDESPTEEVPRSRRRRKMSDLLTLSNSLTSMKNLSLSDEVNMTFTDISPPDDILRKQALWGLNMDKKLLSDDFSKWSYFNLSKNIVNDSFSLKQNEKSDDFSFQISHQEIEEVLLDLRSPSEQLNQIADSITKDKGSKAGVISSFIDFKLDPKQSWKIKSVNNSCCDSTVPNSFLSAILRSKTPVLKENKYDLKSTSGTPGSDQTSQTDTQLQVIKLQRDPINLKLPFSFNKNSNHSTLNNDILSNNDNDNNNNVGYNDNNSSCDSSNFLNFKSNKLNFTQNSKNKKNYLRFKTLNESCSLKSNNFNYSVSDNIYNLNKNVINSSSENNKDNVCGIDYECDNSSLSHSCTVKINPQSSGSTPYRSWSRKNSQDYSCDEFSLENGVSRPVPSALDKEKFRRSLDSAASMVFHHRTGLPLANSPAPARRPASTHFDFDSSINSVSAIRCALYDPSRCENENENESNSPASEERKYLFTWSSPQTNSALLGNFEESVLNGRLEPVSTVHGFTADLGASGVFCPAHLTLPVTVFFYTLGDRDKVSAPYLAHINLGKKGYLVPRSGTIQVTLMNPLGTVIKMFVVAYDLSDMPANTHTFLRQRTLYMPGNSNHLDRKWLRYLIHLRFSSSKSRRIFLHTDIRMIIFCKSDLDTATEHKADAYELRSFLHGPSNPKFSPRK